MANFLHGVQVLEVEEGSHNITTTSSSVIGVIGTAPEAKEEDFPLNTPVLITGSLTEAAKLGTQGTLPSALNGILAQTGASVVVVRIEEGKVETAGGNKEPEDITGEPDNPEDPGNNEGNEDGDENITTHSEEVIDVEASKQKTLLNLIGGANADGTYSGVYSFLASKSRLGIAPRILIAPGFSSDKAV